MSFIMVLSFANLLAYDSSLLIFTRAKINLPHNSNLLIQVIYFLKKKKQKKKLSKTLFKTFSNSVFLSRDYKISYKTSVT